jgi:aspartate 1-decarboxylase
LTTYVIAGERGQGGVGINGAAAHLVHPGDVIIIIGYGMLTDAEARNRAAHVVFVDADNRIVQLGSDPGDVPAGFGLLPSGIGLS